jgi:MoxR-like ATPase
MECLRCRRGRDKRVDVPCQLSASPSGPLNTTLPTPNAAASAAERDALRAAAVRLRDEVSRRIVGQRDVLDEIIMAVLAGGHALLVGVPGLAKTLMVRSVAESMRLDFRRIQFTPDLVPSDITGTELPRRTRRPGPAAFASRGPVFANIVLADEINRAPPRRRPRCSRPCRNIG